MFIEDGPGQMASLNCCAPSSLTVPDLLVACASEARRQARSVIDLDGLIGNILMHGTVGIDTVALQKLDLLRQEASGLARVLEVVASQVDINEALDATEIASCLPLAAQRSRICAGCNGS